MRKKAQRKAGEEADKASIHPFLVDIGQDRWFD